MRSAAGFVRPTGRAIATVAFCATAVAAIVTLGMVWPVSAQTPKPKPAQTAAADAAETAPRRTETVVYDNWTVTCQDTLSKGAPRSCSARLRIVNNKTQQNLVVWEIGKDAAGKPVFALRVPLGVLMKPGVVLATGAEAPHKLDYALCDPQGCEAAGPFDEPLARELSGAAEATITIVAANGQPVAFKVPLKGIAAAMAALQK